MKQTPELPKPHNVSISGHTGGPDASYVNSLSTQIGQLFVQKCEGPYSPQIKHVSYWLEVGGSITDFPKLGVNRVVYYRKDQMLGVDLSLPASRHRDRPISEVKSLLFDLFTAGTERMVQRLWRMRDVKFEVDRFCREVGSALTEFILSNEPLKLGEGDQMIHRGFARLLEMRKLASAIGEEPPAIPLPDGWTIRPDPHDPERVEFVRAQS